MASSKTTALLIVLNIVLLISCVSSHKLACPPIAPPSTTTRSPSASNKPRKCPKSALKFGVCGDWLGLVHEVIGAPPSSGECCTLIKGLADLEAAVCLCTAINANVFGVLKLKVPVVLSLVLNSCGKKLPEGFQCP